MKTPSYRGLFFICAVAVGACQPADGAETVIDQSQLTEGGSVRISKNFDRAQTFRPGTTGWLDRIELHSHINNDRVTPYEVTVSIVDTVAGAPSGAPLGVVTMDWPITAGWLPISFASQNLQLQAEQTYGILLRSTDESRLAYPFGDEASVQWTGNPYPRGTLWHQPNGGSWEVLSSSFGVPGEADLAFQTFMTIPEPAGVSAFAIASAFLVAVRRRR